MANRKGSPVSSSPVAPNGEKGNPLLGMIVDRSSFDESDDFGLGVDLMSVTEDEGTQSDGGVMMKNGKVRRRLRWKPPGFRKKKNISSNVSVISALTNKSTSTTRSGKSFMTNFSRKSNSSFHTFHSTETPVVTNRASQAKLKAQPEPTSSYRETFDGKHSTINNEGRLVHANAGPDKLFMRLNEVSVQRSSTLPSRLDDAPAHSSPRVVDQHDGGSSVISDPFDFSAEPSSGAPPPPATPPPLKPKSLRRPPRDKKQPRKKSNKGSKSPVDAPTVSSQKSEDSSSPPPELSTSSSRNSLSSSISMERENSVLPTLSPDEFEEDRRVDLGAPRSSEDFGDSELLNGPDAAAGGAQVSPAAQEDPVLDELSSGLAPGRVSSGRSVLSTTSNSIGTTPMSSTSEGRQQQQSPARDAAQNMAHKRYNRPVDISTNSPVDGEEDASTSETSPSHRSPTTTIPLDVDEGTFLEAENNLRAIHDMAAEHLAHGEYEEAIEVFEEILRGQQERYGRNHYRVGTALHNLGIVHLKRGDYETAISTCSQAVAVRRDALVPDHPDVAVSLAQLGVAYLECGQHAQALLAFKEALHIRRKFLGPKHPKCSKILNNIGCALYSLDELEGSRLAFEEALGIQRDMLRMIPLVEETQDASNCQSNQILLSIASTLCNIGSIKLRWGRFDDAGVALEEALLIQQSVLGDEHPMVANTMESIDFVEKSKENAIPSAHDVLSKWESGGDGTEWECKENSALCTSQPTFDKVLSLKVFTSQGPRRWYKRMEDAIADSCSPFLGVHEVATSAEPSTPETANDKSGRFSV